MADLAKVLPQAADRDVLLAYMKRYDHELVKALVDRVPAFTAFLVSGGYVHMLQPGDTILLRRDLDRCVWHSVFCLGDDAGESLSFPMRSLA